MTAHQERGAVLFYLAATEAGYGLYTKLGFRTVLDLPVWVAGSSS